jgi:hypothetical protein
VLTKLILTWYRCCAMRFHSDLSNMVRLSTAKDVEDAVKQAYKRFVRGEDGKAAAAGGAGMGGSGGGASGSGGEKQGTRSGTGTNNKDKVRSERSIANASGGGGSIGLKDVTWGANEGDGGSGGADEAAELVAEVSRQKELMTGRMLTMAKALKTTKAEAARSVRARMHENSALIEECNALRAQCLEYKQELARQANDISMLQRALRKATGGSGGSNGAGSSSSLLPAAAPMLRTGAGGGFGAAGGISVSMPNLYGGSSGDKNPPNSGFEGVTN